MKTGTAVDNDAGIVIRQLRYSLSIEGDNLKPLLRRAGVDRKQFDKRTKTYLVPARCLVAIITAANALDRSLVVHAQASA